MDQPTTEQRSFTSVGEVVCYLVVHALGIAAVTFWSPIYYAYVRANFGAEELIYAGWLNSLVFLLIVMFVFLGARMLIAPQSLPAPGRFTSAIEVGTYLFAHVIGYTIAFIVAQILITLLRRTQGAVGNLQPYFIANATIVTVAVMLSFFFMRSHWPRFNRVWFEFDGRSSRFEFWVIYQLLQIAILAVLAAALAAAVLSEFAPAAAASIWIWYLFLLWPELAASVKRCHDRDHSGWFLLVSLIPIVGPIWLFVELGFLRGTVGPNKYGPDPRAGPIGA